VPQTTDSLTTDSDAGPVRLSLPASSRYLAAARVVATSLGAESGLSVDDLEDLRLGVNELVSLLVEAGAGASGQRVELEFETDGSSITVRGQRAGGAGAPMEVDELTARIVEAVADHHEIDGTSFSLTKASSIRGR
jgi:anti-sigma regulatory factor (Ser/Thr protein kinase)